MGALPAGNIATSSEARVTSYLAMLAVIVTYDAHRVASKMTMWANIAKGDDVAGDITSSDMAWGAV